MTIMELKKTHTPNKWTNKTKQKNALIQRTERWLPEGRRGGGEGKEGWGWREGDRVKGINCIVMDGNWIFGVGP